MSPHSAPYDGRGLRNPDPYHGTPRPLRRSAQPPTPVGTKTLKSLKNAPRRRPTKGGGRASLTRNEYENQVQAILEWATNTDEVTR